MKHTNEFSPDRVYRYTLWRDWRVGLLNPFRGCYVQFIGLNPSTADEYRNDPTLRRCIAFAGYWNCASMCMTNLFAFRATNPKVMKATRDPVGPDNDKWLLEVAQGATFIIAAWGANGAFQERDREVRKLLGAFKLCCLGKTEEGFPRHPLYVPARTKLESFR